jgi:hypothetical protein
MYEARSEARNDTASATSSTVPIRPAGIDCSNSRSACGRLVIQSAIGVSISPGQTQLARTPSRPWSSAMLRVRLTTPALAAV